MRFAILALFFALPAAAQAPRFLCNGINADGTVSSDGNCSCASDGSNAARWQPGTVAYSYDKTTLPSDVSSSRWLNEIQTARQAWMNASPSLILTDSGAHATRPDFGGDDGTNSIYWITNDNEWNTTVRSGINAALGVTISLNDRCSGDLSISDADTVLNGTPAGGFNWHDNSSLGTMTHEMGHGLGLGHPCTQNCGALMEAASGGGPSGCGDTGNCFDPIGPQASDIQGIQDLYPNPGALGSTCSGGGCNSGLQCEAIGGSSFCTETCTANQSGACPAGMVCSSVNGGDFCVFSSSPIAQVGDSCDPPACVSSCPVDAQGFNAGANGCNICLGTTTHECFAGCDPNNPQCPGGLPCEPLTDNSGVTHGGACQPPGTQQKGQSCDDSHGCVTGLQCILQGAAQGTCSQANPTCPAQTACGCDANGTNCQCFAATCVATCDVTTGVGCDNTETCLAIVAGEAICETHGTLPVGSSCDETRTDQCDRGELCIPETQNGPATCHAICSQGYSCPSSSDQCLSAGGGLSVCVSGSIGEGEGEGSAGEGEGEGSNPPPTGQCRISRGNFDCPNATDACVTANASDVVGTCTGTSGSTKTFDNCSSDSQCTTGLCDNGVCTVPCDIEQCPAGYTCDAGKAPAEKAGGTPGICVPQSCDANHGICDSASGFHCIYSPEQHYVCAKDGAPLCSCTTTTSTTPFAGVALLIGLVFVQRQRKR